MQKPWDACDGNWLIGNLIFGDLGNAYTWNLSPGSGGNLTLAGTNPTITVNNQTTTLGVNLAGANGLIKAGAGKLVLSGSGIAYTGNTRVNAGRLVLSDAVNFVGGITNGATLELAASGTWSYRGSVLAGNGTVVVTGPGTFSFGTASTGTYISMGAGGLIDVQGGQLYNGYYHGYWTNNLAAMNIASGVTFNLNGNNAFVDALTGAGTVTTATANSFLTVGVAGGSGTFEGLLSDTGTKLLSLTKTGSGTQILSGANTYTGPTTVSNGVLMVNGSLGNTAVTVASNGTLSGNGSIGGPVTVNGTLVPGKNIGTLSFNNNLTLAGNLVFDLNKSLTPSNDLVAVSGTLTNAGTGTLTVTNLGPALVVGDRFQLFSQPLHGSGLAIVSSGVTWANNLAVDGSIQVVAVGGGAPPSFPPGGISLLPGGNISLTATGTVGTSFRLWASTNLTLNPVTNTWTLLSNGTISVSPFFITDDNATNYRQRFYRFSTP